MPSPHPPDLRDVLSNWHGRAKPIAHIAADIGISESCLRNRLARADIDEGRKEA